MTDIPHLAEIVAALERIILDIQAGPQRVGEALLEARAALARISPDAELFDVERLARALTAIWPKHWEGVGSVPPSATDYSYEVFDPWIGGPPSQLASAILAAAKETP